MIAHSLKLWTIVKKKYYAACGFPFIMNNTKDSSGKGEKNE